MVFQTPQTALDHLLEKYAVQGCGSPRLGIDCVVGSKAAGQEIPGDIKVLLPWRVERRFVELQRTKINGTLGEASLLRFAAFDHTGRNTLAGLLYRAIDLAEWLGGASIKKMNAVGDGESVANVIFTLASGTVVAVECSCTLSAEQAGLDRHEIITRRGVASDRVVDTQVPQASVYVHSNSASGSFTDVDAELFGLPENEVWIVRAAFAALRDPLVAAEWSERHAQINQVLARTLEAMREGRTLYATHIEKGL